MTILPAFHRRAGWSRSLHVLTPRIILTNSTCDPSLSRGAKDAHQMPRNRWLNHATLVTLLVVTVFYMSYVSYWTTAIEVAVKYFRHYYLKIQVSHRWNSF